ncbi:hypothetical protein, partial [Burkholderia gladioli]|uniref:hypothetical protein n=1 Tax=Burkholderia gladioli TaxID=28095 RepID=UPI001ABAC1DC
RLSTIAVIYCPMYVFSTRTPGRWPETIQQTLVQAILATTGPNHIPRRLTDDIYAEGVVYGALLRIGRSRDDQRRPRKGKYAKKIN